MEYEIFDINKMAHGDKLHPLLEEAAKRIQMFLRGVSYFTYIDEEELIFDVQAKHIIETLKHDFIVTYSPKDISGLIENCLNYEEPRL